MKYLKGCLVIFISFIVMFIIIYFIYKSTVISNLKTQSDEVELNWKNYTKSIKSRNTKLKLKSILSDSLIYFINISESLKLNEFTTEFEYNEYKINQYLMNENMKNDVNDKLNQAVAKYNESVREYNYYRGIFPNFIIAKRANIKRSYEYSQEINYGFENQNPKIKRKKVEDWIKNGGDYPK